MESIWFIGLIVLGCVVLVNLLLTLRIIHEFRKAQELREQLAEKEVLPELSVGTSAPDFRAKALTGETVRLASLGQPFVFIFVSPHCGNCRRKLPLLVKLRSQAKERAGVEFVLVSDSSAAETYAWMNIIHEEDRVEVDLPILIAPLAGSDLQKIYNPRRLTPYYCFINEQGIIQSRDPLGMGEWPKLQRKWEGPKKISPFSQLYT